MAFFFFFLAPSTLQKLTRMKLWAGVGPGHQREEAGEAPALTGPSSAPGGEWGEELPSGPGLQRLSGQRQAVSRKGRTFGVENVAERLS